MIRFAFKKSAAETGFAAIIGKEISRVSGSPYCHVEIVLEANADFTSCLCFSSREPHGAGFEEIDLSNREMWDLVDLHLNRDQELMVHGYCNGCDGKGYAFVNIAGIALHNPAWHDFTRIICSETGATALKTCAGKDLGGKHAWDVTPGDLHALALNW